MIDLDQFHIEVKDPHFCERNIFEMITNLNLTQNNILWNWKRQEREIIKDTRRKKEEHKIGKT